MNKRLPFKQRLRHVFVDNLSLSYLILPMSQYIPFLDDPIPGRLPGDIVKPERWWVERQEVLEQAGYMLRPRLRPGWQPS